MLRLPAACLAVLGLAACASAPPRPPATTTSVAAERIGVLRETVHRDEDDLLSAGLGLAGLQSSTPPAIADAAAPTAAELRRRAFWTHWRGIADLSAHGFGTAYGELPTVPGRELQAFAWLPGANQPHRLLLQLPDRFDPAQPCLLVTAASGSRGVQGAIALAGAWGLPRGCAVVHTDKGAGSDWIAPGERFGAALDGRRGNAGDSAFSLDQPPAAVAIKHLHSADHPEANWGEHVAQAARFARQQLDRLYPQQAPFQRPRLRVLAVGLSNGGGAVLQAAGLTAAEFDGVLAVAPNVLPGRGGRALFDVASEAALFMPCAMLDGSLANAPLAPPAALGELRCRSLQRNGLLRAGESSAQATEALALLRRGGWSEAALRGAALSVRLDLWRAVAAGYAAAYLRSGPDAMPCGYRYASLAADGTPRSSHAEEASLWWSDASGIPPSAGVGLIDALAAGDDPAMPGLLCLRELGQGQSDTAKRLREALESTRSRPPAPGLPIVILHGEADGLVPLAFSSQAYLDWLRDQQADLDVQWLPRAQHFDALLGIPALAAAYQPLLPAAFAALDRLAAKVGIASR